MLYERARHALASLAVVVVALLVTAAPAAAHALTRDATSTLVNLTNEVRAANGSDPVTAATGVGAVAQAWAQHMADTGEFVHNPDAGGQLPDGWSSWGENIASGSGGLSPEAMHEMWVQSPGHVANIINPEFTVMGVGYATAADGTAYGVEVFARYNDPAAAGAAPEAEPEPEPAPPAPAPAEPAPEGTEPAPAAPAPAPAETTPAPTAAAVPVEPAPTGDAAVAPPKAATVGEPAGAPEPDSEAAASDPFARAVIASTGTNGRIITLTAACGLLLVVSGLAFGKVYRARRAADAAS